MKSDSRRIERERRAAPAWYEEMVVDGVKVRVSYRNASDAQVTEEEAMAYVVRGRRNYPCGFTDQVNLLVDGDEVEIRYKLEPLFPSRIRRMFGGQVSELGYVEYAKCPKGATGAQHGA